MPAVSDSPSQVVTVQVRFADLDRNGHVNHVHYFVFMEVARVRFMRGMVPSLAGHLVIARSECDHLHEIPSSAAEVAVKVEVESVGRTSFVVRHEIRDGDRLVAVGRTVMVARAGSIPRPVTDDERRALLGP